MVVVTVVVTVVVPESQHLSDRDFWIFVLGIS